MQIRRALRTQTVYYKATVGNKDCVWRGGGAASVAHFGKEKCCLFLLCVQKKKKGKKAVLNWPW